MSINRIAQMLLDGRRLPFKMMMMMAEKRRKKVIAINVEWLAHLDKITK